MVSEPQPIARHVRIAVAAILRAAAKQVEDAEKERYAAENPVKTRDPMVSHRIDADGQPVTIGTVAVNKGRMTVAIDPGEAMPYVIERYGPDAVEEIHRIREQYCNSLIAEAKAARAAGKPLPPGVTITVAPPFTAFYPERGTDGLAEIQAMIRDDMLDLQNILNVPAELTGRDQ
jgi:hypothetical protein